MPTFAWLIIAFVVLLDLILVPLLIRLAVRSFWNPIGAAYPPVEPAVDAVTKRYQSFKAGALNLGFSIHVSVDERYLHLRPSGLGRILGLAPASVPWEAIETKRTGRFGHTVGIAGKTVAGPRWCLELAGAGEVGE